MARLSNRAFSTMAACVAILLLVILLVVLWTGGWYENAIEKTEEEKIGVRSDFNSNEQRSNFSNSEIVFQKPIIRFSPSSTTDTYSTIYKKIVTTTSEVPVEEKMKRRKHNESLPNILPSAKGDLEYIVPIKISQNQYEDPLDPLKTAKRHHSGHFRHATAEVWDPHPQYEFTAFGRFFHLRLAHDSSFISPDIKVTHISANTSRRVHPGHQLNCFYRGSVDGDLDSVVSVNLCHGMFCQLLTMDMELQSVLIVLQTLVLSLCIGSIYYTFILHFESVKQMFHIIIQDWKQLKNEAELKILHKYAYQFIFILFIGFFIWPPVQRKIFSSNEETSTIDRFPLLFCHDYFLNPEAYYYYILIYQIIIIIVQFMILVTCYSGYFMVVQHICAQLTIIKDKICQPFINNYHKNSVLANPLDRSEWLVDIIQRLTRCREITNLMNTVCEKIYLFQTFMASILIIIGFFCIPVFLNDKEDKEDVLMFIIFVISAIFPVYGACSIGQRLMDYGMDMYDEACLIPIYEISIKTQKLLLTMIMLHEKPFVMSIGKVFVSSHEFFQSLLRMSLSFAMILHSTQSI